MTINKQDLKRIQELKELIYKYDKQYYELGQSDISDAEYDRLYEEYLSFESKYPELKDFDDAPTKRVGAGLQAGTTTLLPKHTHKSPLLSINKKGKTMKELYDFYQSIGGEGTEVIIQPKLDGITVNINYENGDFVNAATRGNGYVGDLITDNFKNTDTQFPLTLIKEPINSLELRGEAIIGYEFFKKNLAKDYSNPRNAVAGLMRSIDSKDIKGKGIQVMFYDIGVTDMPLSHFDSDDVWFLGNNLDFQIVPQIVVNSFKELQQVVSSKMNGYIQEIDGFNILKYKDFPDAICDGLVIKANLRGVRDKLGMTEKGPRWAYAHKFKSLQALTEIDHIEWSTGKTGKITPTAVFNEISLGGVKITRATLNNIDYMQNLPVLGFNKYVWITRPYDSWGEGAYVYYNTSLTEQYLKSWFLKVGDILYDTYYHEYLRITKIDCEGFWADNDIENDGLKIYKEHFYSFEENRFIYKSDDKGLREGDNIIVERSNDVIPRIIGIKFRTKNDNNFTYPETCPVCNAPVQKIGPQLFCTNKKDCPAQQLGKFEQFVSRDGINITGLGSSILEDFISLGFIRDYADIYRLEEYKDKIITMEGYGVKKYNNLINSIKSSQTPSLSSFIYALSILSVGKATAKTLANTFKSLENFLDGSYEDLIGIQDISDITAGYILEWIKDKNNLSIIEKLIQSGIQIQIMDTDSKSLKFQNMTFVITGTLSKPRKYYQELIEQNGGKVTGSVSKKTDYVLLGDNAGSKEEKAKKLNINIIDENQFMEMIE